MNATDPSLPVFAVGDRVSLVPSAYNRSEGRVTFVRLSEWSNRWIYTVCEEGVGFVQYYGNDLTAVSAVDLLGDLAQ